MSARQEYQVVVTEKEKAELLPAEHSGQPLATDEVEGRTLATVISAGTELAWAYTGEKFPAHPGYASVFEIERVGASVKDLKAGDRVFHSGPHRSFQRAKRESVVPVPEGLSPRQAVMTRMLGVTYATLSTTVARPPAKVVVMGLGLVGNLGAQNFRAGGYEVLAVDPDPKKRGFAETLGIATREKAPLDDPNWAGQTSLVLECSGHEAAGLDGCNLVRKRGEVVQVGAPWKKKTDLSAHAVFHAVFHKFVVLRSGWEWEVPNQPTDFRSGSHNEHYAAGMRWIKDGRVRVDSLIQTRAPKDCQSCYQELLANKCSTLAIVLDWEK